MPATVPLSTPVKSMTSARALAESIAVAGRGAATGPAIDRIVRFLQPLPYAALRRDTEAVLDILHLLGTRRARILTHWLSRTALDRGCTPYWYELHELSTLDAAA